MWTENHVCMGAGSYINITVLSNVGQGHLSLVQQWFDLTFLSMFLKDVLLQ